MPSVATTPRRMEALARALDRAVASAVVPRSRIDHLRSEFMATDAEGRSWAIDPEFQRWGRLNGGRWMVEDPPQQLFMDAELRASLEALEAAAARAIVTGTGLHAPSTPWFQLPVAPAEPASTRASIPSEDSDTTPPPPLDRDPAPVTEPARSSESMPAPASAPPETPPARPATEDPVYQPAPMTSVMSSEVSGEPEPAVAADEEISPAPEAAPIVPAMSPEFSAEPEPTVYASLETTPAPEPAPSRSAIPEAHLRFAGPGSVPVLDDAATPSSATPDATPGPDRMPASAESRASVPRRDASDDHERWVPTSIAPHLMDEQRPEAHDDRAHVVLCGLLATVFLALAVWKGDGRAYSAALLFGFLTVSLIVLNLTQSRHD